MGVGINYQIPGYFPDLQWHLNTDLFGHGYAWIFPHRDSASIGAYASRSTSSPAMLLNSLHQWGARHNLDLKTGKPQAALINFDFRGWRFKNRFLIGDAAGLASGLTGEGISSAIVSGEEVARTILDSGYDRQKNGPAHQKTPPAFPPAQAATRRQTGGKTCFRDPGFLSSHRHCPFPRPGNGN
jgi:hypothetical protein